MGLTGSITGGALARSLGSWRRPGPAYLAIADALQLLVLDGRVPTHTRLPAERDLARALGVSRTTVTAAYAALRERGFLESRRGSGSRTTLPAGQSSDHTGPPLADDVQLDLSHASLPAPFPALTEALQAAQDDLVRYLPGSGYTTLGLPELRAAIAERYSSRGLPTTPDQVMVTAGAHHAFALVARLLVGPGDRVLVEHPTYPNALEAIRAAHGRPIPVPLAPAGWDLDLLASTLRHSAPRLALFVADFHNPTGSCMDAATRESVADLLARTGTPAVIDETLVELGLDIAAPPPLAVHDGSDLVITVGSVSKSIWGGLRIGWVRASAAMIARLASARPALDLGTPVLEQLVTARLLATLDPLVAMRREVLRSQRGALLNDLRDALPSWRTNAPAGGLSLWCELPQAVSTALAAVAERHGVRVAPGPRFGVDGAFERFVRLPYTLPEPELQEAVRRLARAYDVVASGPRPSPAESAVAVV